MKWCSIALAWLAVGLIVAVFLISCRSTVTPQPVVLRLATTTSTADSGLLDAILPDFNTKYNARVDVVAVGTGQALAMGGKGDVDVVLVHARAAEDKFVADGNAKARYDVMYNDFILVGPKDDPAGVKGMIDVTQALAAIASKRAKFASRGDDSGTHSKEKELWKAAGVEPTSGSSWYKSLGQGMGDTLLFANEDLAYTLTDRGTYLAMRDKLPNLAIMVGGESIAENTDENLLNPYGVIPVNPDKFEGINGDLAMKFVEWLISVEVQERIGQYGVDRFGQPLFYPDSEPYRAAKGKR